MRPRPRIVFCTGCKGRLEHLREVYLDNVIFNYHTYPNSSFVLLDYNSTDGLEAWCHQELQELIDAGVVRYLQERTRRHWNMAHAKNVAHLAASGDIVCNLDADNRAVPDFASHLADLFESGIQVVTAPSPRLRRTWDTAGRIAIYRNDFVRLGGYNEDFTGGYGLEDYEFLVRAERAGLRLASWNDRYDAAISHDDATRSRHLGLSWQASLAESRRVASQTESSVATVANQGICWGFAEVSEGSARFATGPHSPALHPPIATEATIMAESRMRSRLIAKRQAMSDYHTRGNAAGGLGELTLYLRFRRGLLGEIEIEQASFDCASDELAVMAGILTRLLETMCLATARYLQPSQLVGRLCDDDESAQVVLNAFHKALANYA